MQPEEQRIEERQPRSIDDSLRITLPLKSLSRSIETNAGVPDAEEYRGEGMSYLLCFVFHSLISTPSRTSSQFVIVFGHIDISSMYQHFRKALVSHPLCSCSRSVYQQRVSFLSVLCASGGIGRVRWFVVGSALALALRALSFLQTHNLSLTLLSSSVF